MLSSVARNLPRGRGPGPGLPFSSNSRNIHTHVKHQVHHVPKSPYQHLFATTENLARSARTFVRRLVGSSTHTHVPHGVGRFSLQRATETSTKTIVSGLSSHVRYAIAHSKLANPTLPRGPAHAFRGGINYGRMGTVDVGLGCARKFSTARTVFHHVAEKNMSVTTRAILELDRGDDMRKQHIIRLKHNQAAKKESPKIRSKQKMIKKETKEEQFARYFASEEPEVTTFLQIALAATPSARVPYSAASSDSARLLPLRAIIATHEQFQAHNQFVSLLYNRMDEADVWSCGRQLASSVESLGEWHDKGKVTVEPWGDTTGLCTELRVRFENWTVEDVHSLFGSLLDNPLHQSGFAVQELRNFTNEIRILQPRTEVATHNQLPVIQSESIPASMLASPALTASTIHDGRSEMHMGDPWSTEFIMPTLDFSSSFSLNAPLTFDDSLSIAASHSDGEYDRFSDPESERWTPGHWGDSHTDCLSSIGDSASSEGGIDKTLRLGFSGDFLDRMGEGNDFF